MLKKRMFLTVPKTVRKGRIYCGKEFLLLVEKLSPEELTCISHCAVFDDCGIDGSCKIQDKVDKIIGG